MTRPNCDYCKQTDMPHPIPGVCSQCVRHWEYDKWRREQRPMWHYFAVWMTLLALVLVSVLWLI
jgi:hypothetical protein